MSDGGGSRVWQWIRTGVMLVLAYLLFTLIQAADRNRQSTEELKKQLVKFEDMLFTIGGVAGGNSGYSAENPTSLVANRQYFDAAAKSGGTLTTAFSAEPPGFNPLTVQEASASAIYALCSASLAERDWAKPEEFKPLMAESWEISPDRLTYRVKLRRGILWQAYTDPESGKRIAPVPVTAHDFKFTIDVIRDPQVNCEALRVYWQDLLEVQAVNDYELLFRWKKPYYGSLASTLGLFPLPRHFYMPDGKFDGKRFNLDHKRNRMIVGCGPYMLSGEWQKGKPLLLERNPTYFGIRLGIAPALKYRKIEIIQHPNTRFQALLGNKLDMLGLTPEQWEKRCNIPEFTTGRIKRHRYAGDGYTYIGYNQRLHCFADRKTRQALTMLIDRQKIMDDLLYGCGKLINSPFMPGSIYADPKLPVYPYDPARAKKLLAEAGWRDNDGDGILERDGKPFVFTMLQISGSTMQLRMLPVIKESFAAAGIDMRLQTVEWSVYLERLNQRKFDACCLGWTGSIDPDPYQIFHSSQIANGHNFIGYRNEALDRAIEELRREFDMKKRIALTRKIEKYLYDDQPYTFLFSGDNLIAVSGDLQNVRVFPYGLQPVSFWKLTP